MDWPDSEEEEVDICEFCSQDLIWTEIEKQLAPAEREEVRRMLGIPLLEEIESLKAELDALVEMFQLLRSTIAAKHVRPLKPPPAHAMVEHQIKLFIEQLHQHHGEQSHSQLSHLAATNEERAVLRYIQRHEEAADAQSGRPLSASRRSSSFRSRPSTAASTSSSIRSVPEIVQTLADSGKMTVFTVDTAVHQLQSLLREERDSLLEQIAVIQSCLDDACDSTSKRKEQLSASAPPSLHDLKQFQSKLQDEVLRAESQAPTVELLRAPLPQRTTFTGLKHGSLSSAGSRTIATESSFSKWQFWGWSITQNSKA